MPLSQANKPPRYENCDVHPTLLKDIFCSDHKSLICSLCFPDHSNCKVESVEDVCKTISPSEVDSLYEDIKTIQDQAKSTMLAAEISIQKAKEQKTTMIKEAKALYEQIISKVAKIFQEIHTEIDENYQKQVLLLSKQQDKINDMIVRLKSSLTNVETFKGRPVDTELFLKIQEHVTHTNQIISDFVSLDKSSPFLDMSLLPSKTILEFLSSHATFGSVSKSDLKPESNVVVRMLAFPGSLTPNTASPASSHHSKEESLKVSGSKVRSATPLSQMVVIRKGHYKVKVKDDKETCNFTGLAVTKNGRRILVDNSNRSIKLFSQDMKFLSSVTTSDNLRDITVTSETEAAVTTATSVVILDTSDIQLRIKSTANISFEIEGISKFDDKLVITSPNLSIPFPASVRLIDRSGRVLWSVYSDQQGEPLFSNPLYVSSRDNNRNVIVTDVDNHMLTLLNGSTGEVIARRQVKGKGPSGVTTDRSGTIYVCYCETLEVAALSGNLSEERIILSKRNGISGRPRAIVYDDKANQLIIAYKFDRKVDCFSLT